MGERKDVLRTVLNSTRRLEGEGGEREALTNAQQPEEQGPALIQTASERSSDIPMKGNQNHLTASQKIFYFDLIWCY